jgi:hypothetical protein
MSPAQLKKLYSGKPVRVRHGNAHQVQVMPAQHKKLMKAHMSGKGMVLTVPSGMGMMEPKPTIQPYHPPIGMGIVKAMRPILVNKTISPIKQASSERAVRAIQGKKRGGNITSTSKDAGKNLIVAGSDRAVKAIEGSGSRDFNLKETINQLKEGRPFKKKDGTAPMSVQSIKSGKPFGGKIGRVNKFQKWTKAVGQFIKPVAEPITQAFTERAVGEIKSFNNPEYQLQTGLDMFQREAPQTVKAITGSQGSKSKKAFESLAPQEVVVYAEPVEKPVEKPRKPRGRKPKPQVVYAEPVPMYSFPQVPSQKNVEELPYEPVIYYGSGKKGSPEMKAKMAHLRAMRKKGGNITATSKDAGKNLIVAGSDRAVKAIEGSGKGSMAMKQKMAMLRSMRKKNGGAMYPAGGALYPAGYGQENV